MQQFSEFSPHDTPCLKAFEPFNYLTCVILFPFNVLGVCGVILMEKQEKWQRDAARFLHQTHSFNRMDGGHCWQYLEKKMDPFGWLLL